MANVLLYGQSAHSWEGHWGHGPRLLVEQYSKTLGRSGEHSPPVSIDAQKQP